MINNKNDAFQILDNWNSALSAWKNLEQYSSDKLGIEGQNFYVSGRTGFDPTKNYLTSFLAYPLQVGSRYLNEQSTEELAVKIKILTEDFKRDFETIHSLMDDKKIDLILENDLIKLFQEKVCDLRQTTETFNSGVQKAYFEGEPKGNITGIESFQKNYSLFSQEMNGALFALSHKLLKISTVEEENATGQRTLTQEWLSKWSEDFVAHAVWNGNFEGVIKEGAVLPAEAILRKTGSVSRENVLFGNRIVEALPKLSQEDIDELESFSVSDESRFQEAIERNNKKPYTLEDKKVLKQIRQIALDNAKKEYFNTNNFTVVPTDDTIEDLLFKANPSEKKFKDYLSAQQIEAYNEIIEKKSLLRSVKKFQNMKIGIVFITQHRKRAETEIKLVNKYSSKTHLIRIAYDSQRDGVMTNYFIGKIQKHTSKNIDHEIYKQMIEFYFDLHQRSFNLGTLCPEVRALYNGVAWNYGNIAILRGNSKEIISKIAETPSKGHEIPLLSPLENQGKFFSLPLIGPETIILGKKSALLPFVDRLDKMGAKYVFIENLTSEQKSFFKC